MADPTPKTDLTLTQLCPKLSDVIWPVLQEMKIIVPEVVLLGPSEDFGESSPPAIWWAPDDEDRSPPQGQGAPGHPGMLGVRELEVVFILFGGEPALDDYASPEEAAAHDCDKTEVLMGHLENILQRRLSSNGWRFVGLEWHNLGRTGKGISAVYRIAFRLPLLREDNPTFKVEHAKARTHGQG